MTLGFEVLVQDVMAAINTSPCPNSAVAVGVGAASTRSGVGRLFIISTSVCMLVPFTLMPGPLATGALSGDCSPPPVNTSGKVPRKPMVVLKRCFSSSGVLP